MLKNQTLFLLIDGNNLAHHLYYDLLTGHKMTYQISRRLIGHLDGYMQNYAGTIEIELVLDRFSNSLGIIPPSLHLLTAEYPQTADDVLIDRFWFHHMTGHPNLVITNDSDILEEINQAGGLWMRVYDFVRRQGLENPVFREPIELPISFPEPQLIEKIEPTHSLRSTVYYRMTENKRKQSIKKSVEDKKEQPEFNPLIDLDEIENKGNLQEAASETHTQPSLNEDQSTPAEWIEVGADIGTEFILNEPIYFLDLETWPLAEGIHFLINSFCPVHKAEYQDLFAILDDGNLKPADLRALTELLLYTCSEEPGFSTQGSLMKRVRLALLNARGEWLTLSDLISKTGLQPSGLQGKIKHKAGRWLSILQPDEK